MSLTLTRNALEYTRQAGQCVWPLIVACASDEVGLSDAVFVYHVYPDSDQVEEIFECVASLPQMSEIDTSPQLAGEVVTPYYRKNVMRLDCRSPEEADDVWRLVQVDVRDLLLNFRRAQALTPTEQVVFE